MKNEQKEKILSTLKMIKKILLFDDDKSKEEIYDYFQTLKCYIEDDESLKEIERNINIYEAEKIFNIDNIVTIENKISNIIGKKEVVFMPYKFSMWDAMESVYLAARQDNRVEVKVIPVPYESFDKSTGRTNFHYEGNDFSKMKEYVYYGNYELDVEKPDVIVIHNPYDNNNLVTKICDEYFSSELIKHTKHLVYIPYDVVIGNKIDSNYCLMPGVQNAWRVYVQSKAIREEYIKWNDSQKIKALGSPKIDAVINPKEGDTTWPKEWLNRVKGKKIILYNTHLSGIISECDLQIERIQEMGEIFESRDDMILLWRPHPLSIQTVEAMNPRFLKAYLMLIDHMKSLNNVIYDDKASLNDSIAMSDAYIGDPSSLVMLLGFAGKPIYLHSALKRSFTGYDALLGINAVVKGNYVWVSHSHFNGLFKINLKNNEVSFLTDFPCESKNTECLFENVYSIGDELLFIPYAATHFVWFNCVTNEIRTMKCEATTKIKIFLKIQTKSALFLFAQNISNPNWRIDFNTKEIFSFQLDISMLISQFKVRRDWIWGNRGVFAKGRFWLVLSEKNVIVSISQAGKMAFYPLNVDANGFRQIAYDGDKFWLIPTTGIEIICWDDENGIINKIHCIDEHEREYKNCAYDGIVFEKEYAWILPNAARYVLRIDKTFYKVDKIELPKLLFKGVTRYETIFSGYQLHEEIIYLFPNRKSFLVRINIITSRVYVNDIRLSKEMDFEWKKKYLFSPKKELNTGVDDFIYRDTIFSIDYYLSEVKADTTEKRKIRQQSFLANIENGNGCAGVAIWDSIINDLEEADNNV